MYQAVVQVWKMFILYVMKQVFIVYLMERTSTTYNVVSIQVIKYPEYFNISKLVLALMEVLLENSKKK